MPRITKQETASFQKLYEKSYTFLHDNFHKFNQKNKIQVAIAICKISVPQKIAHSGGVAVQMQSIQKEYSGQADGTLVNRIVEFDIGSPDTPETS